MKVKYRHRYKRFDALMDGTFQEQSGIKGLLMCTNVNKTGCCISLTQNVEAGKSIDIEINLPNMPVHAKGRVVWIKKEDERWLYDFDAGIQLEEISPLDRQRILDCAFDR